MLKMPKIPKILTSIFQTNRAEVAAEKLAVDAAAALGLWVDVVGKSPPKLS